jgi:transposase
MLVVGAMAVIRYAQRHGTRRPWLAQLLARRTTKVAAVALANKTARIKRTVMPEAEELMRRSRDTSDVPQQRGATSSG